MSSNPLLSNHCDNLYDTQLGRYIGYVYTPNPTYKIFYSINGDRQGFRIWSEENPEHIFYFSKEQINGTDKINLDMLISISPNPSSDIINITATSLEIKKISLIDLHGKTVIEKTENLEHIDVSNCTKGLYLLQVETSKGCPIKIHRNSIKCSL